MADPELKPCPWPECGALLKERPRNHKSPYAYTWYAVVCPACKARGPRGTKDQARERWNQLPRRPAVAELPGEKP